jgi:hypothetical protein
MVAPARRLGRTTPWLPHHVSLIVAIPQHSRTWQQLRQSLSSVRPYVPSGIPRCPSSCGCPSSCASAVNRARLGPGRYWTSPVPLSADRVSRVEFHTAFRPKCDERQTTAPGSQVIDDVPRRSHYRKVRETGHCICVWWITLPYHTIEQQNISFGGTIVPIRLGSASHRRRTFRDRRMVAQWRNRSATSGHDRSVLVISRERSVNFRESSIKSIFPADLCV